MPAPQIIDFTAARRRIEARVEYSIEIAASAIPVEFEFEFAPCATLIERLGRSLTDAQLAELIHLTLEESL